MPPKIYAAPFLAANVLVYNTESEAVSGISVAGISEASLKWDGVTAVGAKLYCAPFNAQSILVVDTVDNYAYGIDTTTVSESIAQWSGITALGTSKPRNPRHLDGIKGWRKRVSDIFTHKNSGSCI